LSRCVLRCPGKRCCRSALIPSAQTAIPLVPTTCRSRSRKEAEILHHTRTSAVNRARGQLMDGELLYAINHAPANISRSASTRSFLCVGPGVTGQHAVRHIRLRQERPSARASALPLRAQCSAHAAAGHLRPGDAACCRAGHSTRGALCAHADLTPPGYDALLHFICLLHAAARIGVGRVVGRAASKIKHASTRP